VIAFCFLAWLIGTLILLILGFVIGTEWVVEAKDDWVLWTYGSFMMGGGLLIGFTFFSGWDVFH
jgi:hypothetical protein